MYYVPTWRSGMLQSLAPRGISMLDNGDVYQFGVFSGNSMVDIATGLAFTNRTIHNFFGFDVFTGMPPEENEELLNPAWGEGTFNIQEYKKKYQFHSNSIKGIISEIEDRVRETLDNYGVTVTGEVKIFDGLVQDTLNSKTLEPYDLHRCSYVDVDFDLYYPSMFGLQYLVDQNIIGDNTVVGYDDWGGKPGFDTLSTGESRAHKEVFFDNDIEAQLIVISISGGPLTRVDYIGRKINKENYYDIFVEKVEEPDWKWGKNIDHIQSVWQINPTRDIYIKNRW